MAKLIPFSLVAVTIAVPILLARRPAPPNRSLRLLRGIMVGYILLWGWLCLNVYTRYVFIE